MRNFPDRPVVGVGAVVFKGDQVLLVRRAHPPRQGSWSLPGGKQELGETVAQAVLREVREETGITIRILGLAAVVDLIDAEAGTIRSHYTVIDLLAEWVEGEAVAGDDAAEVAWAGPDDWAHYALTPQVQQVIAQAATGAMGAKLL
jgi:mutator protein MutT